MTPEAESYLAKAREDLDEARQIARIDLAKAAARAAYYAAFHAAEALIIDRTGKIAKTHSGVRAELARLIDAEAPAERAMLTFLARAYKLKEIGDYAVGHGATVTKAEAQDTIDGAADFIDRVAAMLADPLSDQR